MASFKALFGTHREPVTVLGVGDMKKKTDTVFACLSDLSTQLGEQTVAQKITTQCGLCYK
jgi:hypothetical protein